MQSKEDFIGMCTPVSAECVSLIRLTLSGVFSRAGATYDGIEDAKITVSEAVTNVVKHAYKEKNNVGITSIYFEILGDKVKVVTSDKGDNFNYETTKPRIGPYDKDEDIDFLREGGLSLFLIKSLMDEVTVYRESGVTISMAKYIKEEQVRGNGKRVEIS